MRDALRNLTALSFLGGAALWFCPPGRVRRVMELLLAAMLAAAAAAPVKGLDYDLLSLEEAKLGSAEARILQSGRESGDTLRKLLLQKNCESYVEDRAEALGLRGTTATVTLRQSGDGSWLPWALSVRTAGAPESAERLRLLIRDELGIPVERQEWTLDE